MNRVVETSLSDEKALFIVKEDSKIIDGLIKSLKTYDISIDSTSEIPYSFKNISYLFCSLKSYSQGEIKTLFDSTHTRIAIITPYKKIYDQFAQLIEFHEAEHVKVIHIEEDTVDMPEHLQKEIIEKIIWFMLSQSPISSLDLARTIQPVERTFQKPQKKMTFSFTRRRIVLVVLFILVVIHTLFLVPLGISGYFLYQSAQALKTQDYARSLKNLDTARPYFAFAKGSYALASPGLKFLFLSVGPNNIFSIEENIFTFIETTVDAVENGKFITGLLLQTSKSDEELSDMKTRLKQLEKDLVTLENTSQILYDKLDYDYKPIIDARSEMETLSGYLHTSNKLVHHFNSIFAENSKKRYIVFFYNNMEIRPGGGFIGSFADVTFENFTLKEFEVYDVYDADGQLTTHVRPPKAIRELLNQPHWFLRDSNFTPDFAENVETAEYFLDKSINISSFDGAFGITTTALTYILEAFGDVYISDFDETINADNFYIKAQSQHELDFFPGSNEKKSFLSTVGRTLMLKLDTASPAKLGLGIKRALDEKHIVILTDDPEVQKDIDILGWSGKVLQPQCVVSNDQCVLNHILPVDANLGVNKANYFVTKLMKLASEIDSDGTVTNNLSVSFTNTSAPNVYPGGTYVNYMQMYIPDDAEIKNIEIDGTKLRNYDVNKDGVFKIIGIPAIIPEQTTRVVTITYALADPIPVGTSSYQIVLQKQIGSFTTDFSLEVNLPDNIRATDTNFKSVAKNSSVLYNSNLSTNKVFVIDLLKE